MRLTARIFCAVRTQLDGDFDEHAVTSDSFNMTVPVSNGALNKCLLSVYPIDSTSWRQPALRLNYHEISGWCRFARRTPALTLRTVSRYKRGGYLIEHFGETKYRCHTNQRIPYIVAN